MPDQLMTRDEIVRLMTCDEIKRRLRLIMSQRVCHRPLTMAAVAERCGLSRRAVYDAAEGIMGDDVRHVLSDVLRQEMPDRRVQEMIEAASTRPFNNGYDRLASPVKRASRRPPR